MESKYEPILVCTVDQLLWLYPNNAPVCIHELWTHNATYYSQAQAVPEEIRAKNVYAFNGYPYTASETNIGITITVDMGHPRPRSTQ